MTSINNTRPEVVERKSYLPSAPSEEFIVPLLKDWIEPTLRSNLSLTPHTRVLDAGCGRQPFRSFIEGLGGQYVGFDVNQSPENAVEFLGALDEPLPAGLLASPKFDVILCTEVLEHVVNWQAAFVNLFELLVPGGRLIITCPHVYQLHEEPYDFWRATSYSIEWHAKRVGLAVERIERLGNAWDVLGGVLANMHPSPYRRTLLQRGLGRLTRVFFYRILFPLLRRRWFHLRLDPNSTLYLANAAVLRKP